MRHRRQLAALLAACAVSWGAAGAWVSVDLGPLAAASLRSGCVAAGQYERAPTPITGAKVVVNGLPDGKQCYFKLSAGPQDEWIADFAVLRFGPAPPGPLSNIVVTWAPTPPGPAFTSADIGAIAAAGSTALAAGVYTVRGSGADVWGAADEFRFVYAQLDGDGQITARVATLSATDPWTKAGVMIRESVQPGARYAFALVTPGNGSDFQWRATASGAAGPSGSSDHATRAPAWLRVQRIGSVFRGWQSVDGVTWTRRGADVTIAMPSTVLVGLAITSHLDGTLATATFSNVGGIP